MGMGVAQARTPVEVEVEAVRRQFDFWLGEWDATWGDGDQGTNSVYQDFEGKVIVENFDGRPASEYQGLSLSVYDVSAGRWKQTWVDSEGNYLDFVGGWDGSEMVLCRESTTPEGTPASFRMRWFEIGDEAFDWAWERSLDGGAAWEALWEIRYSRVV